MIAWALFLSSFTSSPKLASTLGFFVIFIRIHYRLFFIQSLLEVVYLSVGAMVAHLWYTSDRARVYRTVLSLFPGFHFTKIMKDISMWTTSRFTDFPECQLIRGVYFGFDTFRQVREFDLG